MPAPSSLQLTAEFTPLSAQGAAALLAVTHGLVVQHIDRLATERDDTFRVTTRHGLLVAKFAHPLDDADALLDQVTVLRSLAADYAELPVQRVVPATDGALLTSVADDAGRARLVRVLTHLDGSLLGSAPRSTENMRE
ncbi:MAG: hypothetical protein Q7J04_07725, partial [Microcella sp.]|nr:hypothetical protein [Microcella sp.]